MGHFGSKIYSYGKRLVMRYNVENRTYKFLDQKTLPPAPRHVKKHKEVPLSREALEDIHCKNAQLNEYLKKVYLTSTSEITGTPSNTKRPKPKKENEIYKRVMFYEPKMPASGCCTLSNVVEILQKYDPKSTDWNINAIAEKFSLNKKDVGEDFAEFTIVLLISYYSLYTFENLSFLNIKASDTVPIEIDKTVQLEKESLKKITSK